MNRAALVVVVFVMVTCFSVIFARPSEAAPAFARQTGLDCNTCHFQHYPLLKPFGRNFKAGGFTMVGAESMVEGELLSLPAVLNASLVFKGRYRKTSGDDELADERNRGELEVPDEGALLIGGRVGENIGFLLEAQLVDPDSSAWASFKMPFVYDYNDVKAGAVIYTTDAGGPSYGFELSNTGAMRMQRVIEHRLESSAQQYINTATEATGVALYLYHNLGHVVYSAWAPEHISSDARPYLHYGRVAATPYIEGWDLMLGAQLWEGDTRLTDDTTSLHIDRTAEAWAVDAQAQGAIKNYPLGVYLTYGEAGSSGSKQNIFNASTAEDRLAFTALAELGIWPSRATLGGAYRDAENGAAIDEKENAITAFATFLVTQNVELQIDHTWYDNDVDPASGDELFTLMLFAAF